MVGVYAGSFDVFTFGHLDIINKAYNMFGELHVLIADNPNKKYMFNKERRFTVVRGSIRNDKNIIVKEYDGLVVDYAKKIGNAVLVRGIRNPNDVLEEMMLADINKEISNINTVFIPCENETRNCSSSLVKELFRHGKDVSRYVPYYSLMALQGK